MAKSKRSMNPADELRKKQRKRELKKNKETRKNLRENVLAKKDVGKVRQDIARLEHLAGLGQLDRIGQARLDELKLEVGKIEKAKKATELTGAQAAYAARMQENEKKTEKEARKLVFDPKSGKFVPAKVKEKKVSTSTQSGSESSSESSSEDDSDSDMESDDEIAIPQEEPPVDAQKILTESDDEYEIPLPPGPPPLRPFEQQFTPVLQVPPPPPPGGPPRAVYTPGGRIPPPPPFYQQPVYQQPMYQHQPVSQHQMYQQPVYQYQLHQQQSVHQQPVLQQQPAQTYASKAVHYEQESVAPTISAEPQLRDLQKELLGFVPAALRRKQAQAKKVASLPKGARPNINAAPSLEDEE